MRVILRVGVMAMALGLAGGAGTSRRVAAPKATPRAASKIAPKATPRLAPKNMTSPKAPASVAAPAASFKAGGVTAAFQALKKRWRLGEIDDKSVWVGLGELSERPDSSRDERAVISQAQAQLLYEDGYPVLSALYAAQSIRAAENPVAKDMVPAWEILAAASKQHSVQNIIELLADGVDLGENVPPAFGNDWYYFRGAAADADGNSRKALDMYGRLAIDDRHYLSGRYLAAMIHVAEDRTEDAERVLREVMTTSALSRSTMPPDQKVMLLNYTRLALGRIYYQDKKFREAVVMFRLVSRDTSLFYDALFGQSWAFFMAGYPNHALGALHSVDSPFFRDYFNPEASLLRSIIYYWLCRYDDSRTALAGFMDKHSDEVYALGEFLDRRSFSDEAAYQLFEDLVSGVSEQSLGLSRAILKSAATKDSMMLARDQYASVVEEDRRMRGRGIFGTRQGTDKALDYLERWGLALRKDIGSRFLKELRAMKTDYEQLYAQAQFLYVELLMSEKEQLLGKELHGGNKMSQVDMKKDVVGWGRRASMSWGQSDKNEYWWDELGYYIYSVEPRCAVSATP